jgi:hypothetical protein
MTPKPTDSQKFNQGHIIEGLDRCHIIMMMMEDLLMQHPAVLKADCSNKIAHANLLMMEAYQQIGALDD